MKTNTRVVVIGGGIAGCSTLYHLCKEGITDCVMVERDELTSGTTWHSAAQVTNFGGNQTMVGLKTHSIKLYQELANDPDYAINYHHGTGGLRLASTEDHWDGYKHFMSMAKGMGVDFELIDAQECARRHPLITTDGLKGALWDPMDGDIDPAQLCQALAKRSRKMGAEIYRFNPVENLTQKENGEWIVHTKEGDITCEIIVNAGGYRCNEVGAMMGVEHPVVSMEHQYMLTEPIPQLEELDYRVPLIRCPTDDFYSRQEKKGLLVGFYEQDCKTWGMDGIDPGFVNALCPDDLDRVVDVMENTFARVPCLTEVGIHTVINGPITYTPDGLPLVGPIPGKTNAFCITGLRAGLGEGGGHGWLLAQMIAHGEAEYDTWCLDPRRFTAYADQEYTASKTIEDYQNEFRFHMPHEARPAGRNRKTTAITETLRGMNAHFTTVNGWERADFFAPTADFEENLSFRFNNVKDIVKAEVENVKNNVGIAEVNGFNRYELSGNNVHEWLETVMCSKINKNPGRVSLGYFLNHHGNVKGEATIANLENGKVWYGSAAASEYHDRDWLNSLLPKDDSIKLEVLTNDYTILVVAGAKSRELLMKSSTGGGDATASASDSSEGSLEEKAKTMSVAELMANYKGSGGASSTESNPNMSAQNFKWLHTKNIQIADVDIVAMSVSFSGELAWELHIPNDGLKAVFDKLMADGAEFGIKPFGGRAVESMRLEKGYRHWKADLITEYNPFESALDRFVNMDADFVGKQALIKMQSAGNRRTFVAFNVDCDIASPHEGDSVIDTNGKVIGTVTSAAYGFRTNKNIAFAFVDNEYAKVGSTFKAEIVGETFDCTVCEFCQYDPNNELVRN